METIGTPLHLNPEMDQSAMLPQAEATITPEDNDCNVAAVPQQAYPAEIPEWLLWNRFDAKLDNYNKVAQAREDSLKASGLRESTIYRFKSDEKKSTTGTDRELKATAATLRDRIRKIRGRSVTSGKGNKVMDGKIEVPKQPARDDQKQMVPDDKRHTTRVAMREDIQRIKRGDTVNRNSMYWQSKQQRLSATPKEIKAG